MTVPSDRAAFIRAGRRSPPRRAAFTLVELLVVILIIMALLATLLPTLAHIRTKVMVNKSQAIVNLISGAVLEYHSELGRYPADVTGLVQALTGYRNDDDKEGPGFRLRKRGRVYGPYNGTEGLGWGKDEDGPVDYFFDAFGNTVLYYKYNPDEDEQEFNVTSRHDGPEDQDDESETKQKQIVLNIEYLKGPDDKFFRTDFVVITRGPDGEWGGRRRHPNALSDPDSYKMYPAYSGGWIREFDDVTNFLRQ